jgi:hypothetical protein
MYGFALSHVDGAMHAISNDDYEIAMQYLSELRAELIQL